MGDFNMAAALGQHPNWKPKKKRTKRPVQHERTKVHKPFADYLRIALDHKTQLFWHTPNEGNVPVQYRVILKALGLKAGVPDILLLTKPCGMVALEAKYGSNKLSKDQEIFKAVWVKFFPWITFYTPEEAETQLRALGVPLRARYGQKSWEAEIKSGE